jgi:hypothetical protein
MKELLEGNSFLGRDQPDRKGEFTAGRSLYKSK